MSAPKVRPPNPEHLRLIVDLLANPANAMCPICGNRGFWDNREGKKNPKSPDYKCKNKECPGATPLKGKNPYAVWLPEGFTASAPMPSRRVQSPPNEATGPMTPESLKADPQGRGEAWESPAEAPNADETEDEAKERKKREARQALLRGGLALWDAVEAHQVEAGRVGNFPVDAASISRFASTLWITMKDRGLV